MNFVRSENLTLVWYCAVLVEVYFMGMVSLPQKNPGAEQVLLLTPCVDKEFGT